jgi:hypothetical protein
MLLHADLAIIDTPHGSIALKDIFFAVVVLEGGRGLLLSEVQSLVICPIHLRLYLLQLWVDIQKIRKASLLSGQLSTVSFLGQFQNLCLLFVCKVAAVEVVFEQVGLIRWIHFFSKDFR